MKRIIFVCTGNTCRSPMAELILKNKFKEKGVKGIRVSSAGLSATENHKISKNSLHALKKYGIKGYAFRSKQLTKEMIMKADLILTMTKSQKESILSYFPKSKTLCICDVTGKGDISDPYGQDLAVYQQTASEIEDACNIILEKILEE